MGRYVRQYVSVAIIGVIAGVAWFAPSIARACSCGGTSTLVAPAGAEHPVGAAVYFAEDCGGNLEAWSVTVDGAPAMLVNTNEWSGVRGVAIEPAPAMGAEVVLTLACSNAYGDPACTDPEGTIEKARFTIAGPDTTAPPEIDSIALEQEDGEFFLGCDGTAYDLRIGAVIEASTIEPGSWFEVSFTKNGEEIARSSHVIPSDGVIESSHHVMRSELGGAEACVGVVVRDAAGNATELEQDCAEISGEGCGCTADPRRGWVMSLLGVLALVGLRRAHSRRLLSRRA